MSDKRNYTSFALSKRLHDSGCSINSIYSWCCRGEYKPFFGEKSLISFMDGFSSSKNKYYKSYDILNDICSNHVLDFFGQTYDTHLDSHNVPLSIFKLMQEGKKFEAENLIIKWCVFTKDS